MPKAKIKAKSKATSKVTSKTKAKPKKKIVAKSKTTSKAKLKSKPKAKPKTKVAAKTKTKKPVKAKAKAKSKAPLKAKTKSAKKAKAKSKSLSGIQLPEPKINLTDDQKSQLLQIIEKIVILRKGEDEGMKSYENIYRILDKYNQHYTQPSDKFNAIAKFGLEKDPEFLPKTVFVPVLEHEKEELELYKLLENIWIGKVGFSEAKNKMIDIYSSSRESKIRRHTHH